MSVYMVSWNLNKEGSGYDSARNAIISRLLSYDLCYEGRQVDTFAFVWIPDNLGSGDIYNHLKDIFDDDDRLIVSSVPSSDKHLFVSKKMKEWLHRHL